MSCDQMDAKLYAYTYDPILIQILVDAGVDLNIQDEFGRTALHNTTQCALTTQGRRYRRIRHYTESHNCIKAAKLLLKSGANLHTVERAGSKVLHYAAYGGCKDIVQFLLSTDIDLNARTGNGNTAPSTASIRGHLDVVKLLNCRH